MTGWLASAGEMVQVSRGASSCISSWIMRGILFYFSLVNSISIRSGIETVNEIKVKKWKWKWKWKGKGKGNFE